MNILYVFDNHGLELSIDHLDAVVAGGRETLGEVLARSVIERSASGVTGAEAPLEVWEQVERELARIIRNHDGDPSSASEYAAMEQVLAVLRADAEEGGRRGGPGPELEGLGRTGLRAENIHARVSGWHFAKEALSVREREILEVAEALLHELDALHGGMVRTGLRPEEAAEVAELIQDLVAARAGAE